MGKHMMILNKDSEALIKQLLEEDLPTFLENAIDTIDRKEDYSSLPVYASLFIDQLKEVQMSEVADFLNRVIGHLQNGSLDQAKVDLVLLKNFIGDIQVIYSE